jgi:two-component system response regulator NreC
VSEVFSVYIIDDHPVIKDGLPPLLEKASGIRVIGSAPEVNTALKELKYLTPDVILLDVSMPQLSGLDAIALIRDELPKVRILMFSMHEKEAYVYRALSAGALGYVVKGSPLNELIKAIETVGSGHYFLSPGLEEEVLQTYLSDRQAKNEPEGGYDLLTEREQQVFRLLVAGSTTQQISKTLDLSPKTVEKHRTSITKKLGTGNLVEMVKYAVQLGIIDPTTWSS